MFNSRHLKIARYAKISPMSWKTEVKELKTFSMALGSITFLLWSVFPIHVLGWLLSAIARHPLAETAIKDEPVYEFILFWKGGSNLLFPSLLLLVFLAILFSLSYLLGKSGYSAPEDGMCHGRIVVRKFLIPSFLSASAFVSGTTSNGSIKGIVASSVLLLIFALFSVLILYLTDTTEHV